MHSRLFAEYVKCIGANDWAARGRADDFLPAKAVEDLTFDGEEPPRLCSRERSRSVMKEDKKMPAACDEGKNPQHPGRRQLKFRWLPGAYTIVRLDPEATVPEWATKGVFSSVTRTADELSIVCPAEKVPANLSSECHWICFKLEGPFPFSQTGVLLSFIEPLSSNGVPIFAISTYDTDYVLVREEFMGEAQQALGTAGHALISDDDESRRKLSE